MPVEVNLAQLPSFSLYADGRVITQGPQILIYPGPALPNLLERKLSPEGVVGLLEAAQKAGLTGPDRDFSQAQNFVADVPTTTFTTVLGAKTHRTSAYGLGFLKEVKTLTAAEKAAILALEEFNDSLGNLEGILPKGSVGGEAPYGVTRMRVFASPRNTEIVEGQPPVTWPLDQPLNQLGEPVMPEGYRCAVVEGPDLTKVLEAAQKATGATPWTSGNADFTVVFRPLLPDETGCVPAEG